MFCHKKFLLPGRSGSNGGSPGRAGRWAFRSGLRPSLQAQRPELNYKDNSFNLFLPLRVYFYECSKASRQIYKLISQNPQINAVQMAENMGVSARQVQKYLKRLQELKKITRVGGRKIGKWKIIDEDYEGFFDRI